MPRNYLQRQKDATRREPAHYPTSLGKVHRLVNPSAIKMEIIEVQSDGFRGEVNAVRLDDYFVRSQLVLRALLTQRCL